MNREKYLQKGLKDKKQRTKKKYFSILMNGDSTMPIINILKRVLFLFYRLFLILELTQSTYTKILLFY